MEHWDKEERVVYEATGEGDDRVEADTYDQVVKNTTATLLKLVNRDRAIIKLLRMEQGSRTFNEFLADIEDQNHLCHSWEKLTPEDMKRISLLGGLKDRTLAEKAIAEEYDLKKIIQMADGRWQKCPAGERTCNTCGEKGHFVMSKLCTKKKKKTARRVKGEQKDTSSKSSDTEGEKEVNRVIWERAWPGASTTARRKDVRLIRMERDEEIGSKDKSDTKGEQEEDNQANRDRVWPGTREKARQHDILKTEPEDNIQAKNVTKAGEEGQGQDARVKDEGAGRIVEREYEENQDGHRDGAKTKGVTDIGDSYQDRHKAGDKTNQDKPKEQESTENTEGYKRPMAEQEKRNKGSQGEDKKDKNKGAGLDATVKGGGAGLAETVKGKGARRG